MYMCVYAWTMYRLSMWQSEKGLAHFYLFVSCVLCRPLANLVVFIHVFVLIKIGIFFCLPKQLWLRLGICVMYIYTYIYKCVYIYIYMHIYLCIYICVHIYIFIYIFNIYIYIYVYIYCYSVLFPLENGQNALAFLPLTHRYPRLRLWRNFLKS